MGRISPNYIVQDGVIPRTALPRVMSEIDRLSARSRSARRQRVSRGRRQSASAGSVRSPHCWPGKGGRGALRANSGAVHREGRIDHRRTRRRRRKETDDVKMFTRAGPGHHAARALRLRSAERCRIRPRYSPPRVFAEKSPANTNLIRSRLREWRNVTESVWAALRNSRRQKQTSKVLSARS